jgi:hypothetical protein
MQVDCGFQKWTKWSKSCIFHCQFLSWAFPISQLWMRFRDQTVMGILQKEPRLVLDQKIHKVCCLAILEFWINLCNIASLETFIFEVSWYGTHRRWKFLILSFSWRTLRHISFETLRCLHNILHARKWCSRMSSALTRVKSELAGLLDCMSSPNFVLLCKKHDRHFFTTKIWGASLSYTPVSSISISLALRPLRIKRRTIARCSISLFFAYVFTKNEAPHNGTPYWSISVNCRLLDSLFRKEYRHGLIISPFSTSEKQQAKSRTFRSPL